MLLPLFLSASAVNDRKVRVRRNDRRRMEKPCVIGRPDQHPYVLHGFLPREKNRTDFTILQTEIGIIISAAEILHRTHCQTAIQPVAMVFLRKGQPSVPFQFYAVSGVAQHTAIDLFRLYRHLRD